MPNGFSNLLPLCRESGTPGYPLKEIADREVASWVARSRKDTKGPSLNSPDSAPSEGELLKALEELAQPELGGPGQ